MGTPRDGATPASKRSHRVSVSDDVEISTYLEIAEARAPGQATEAAVAGQDAPATRDAVAILDFGSQYTQLIARRVREQHVYCELLPHDVDEGRVRALSCGNQPHLWKEMMHGIHVLGNN